MSSKIRLTGLPGQPEAEGQEGSKSGQAFKDSRNAHVVNLVCALLGLGQEQPGHAQRSGKCEVKRQIREISARGHKPQFMGLQPFIQSLRHGMKIVPHGNQRFVLFLLAWGKMPKEIVDRKRRPADISRMQSVKAGMKRA